MSLNYVISFRKNKTLWIFFVAFPLFYTSLLFSNPYLEQEPAVTSSWTCKRDFECLRYLNSDLDTQNDYSLYKICHNEYHHVKTCCESLNNCSSNYGVSRDLNNLKINLLNSADNQTACSANNMPSLIASIEGKQKEVCQLGARNCKATCENKLNDFKQRLKNCFSISSSLDEALKQAKSSQNNSVCYSDLKTVAERYKRQSLKGNSELRENLSVQDIVDCEGVRNKGKGAVGAKKAMELCSEVNQELLVRQQQEQAEKEELERQEREKERLEELERQKEEEHRRKQEEFEDRARMIQADMGYNTNENKGALDSQAQSFGIKGQSPEDQKSQVYGAKAIKTSEIKEPKESVKKETAEKEKKEDKKPDSEAEEEDKKEDEKPVEKDKKTEKQALDASKSKEESKDENSNKLKSIKQSEAGKAKSPLTNSNLMKAEKLSSTHREQKKSEEPKGFLAKSKSIARKSWDKTKSFSKKTWSQTKAVSSKVWTSAKSKFSVLKVKSKRSLAGFMSAKANELCEPQITYQMLYQSVEAPQIVPLDKQELQSHPDNPIFKSYDLMRGKSAGVLIKIHYPQACPLNDKKFNIGMFIDKEFVQPRCLSYKKTAQGIEGFTSFQPSSASCVFSIKDFSSSDEILRFVELPIDSIDKDKHNMPVQISLFGENGKLDNVYKIFIDPRNIDKLRACGSAINLKSVNEFCLNMYSAKKLSIGVVSIKGKCRNKDLSSSPDAINRFINSDEVQKYLPSIFPMPEPNRIEDIIEPLRLEHVRRYEAFIKRKALFKINQGAGPTDLFLTSPSCDNQKVWPNESGEEWSFGIQEMIESFARLNMRSSKNRIAIVVSRDFLNYHNVPTNVVGFVWNYRGRSKDRNILFLDENYTETGTLLHELAHSLGQLKEFYKKYYDSKQQKPVLCQRFNGSQVVSCWDNYMIPRGLKALKGGSFEWLTQRYSIMHDARSIYQKWIDRETFQKVFRKIRGSAVYQAQLKKYKEFPKILVSAFYDKKTGEMQALEKENLDFKTAYLTPPLTDGFSDEGILNYVKIQLEQNNKAVYQVRHPAEMYIDIYTNNKEDESIPLPTSLIHAVIPVIGQGKFKIRFFKGAVWFDDKGQIVEEIREQKLPQEIPFTWPER